MSFKNVKEIRTVFEDKVRASHARYAASVGPVPERLFNINYRTGRYEWPGLEGRFQDFVAGADAAAEMIKRELAKLDPPGLSTLKGSK